jgi:putative molybdopterin biosynthesis protein
MFRRLLTFEQAQRLIQQQVRPKPLGVEKIKLLTASGRILAEDVTANIDIPPFARSTVDGYAVRAEDTFGAEENAPVTLKVKGTVPIGELPKIKVTERTAAEIVTGAPIPKGADAVVMVEQTEKEADVVRVFTSTTRNANTMKAGADIKKGGKVLKSGTLMRSKEIGALAALGIAEVLAYKVPRVAVFSTGPEITDLGKPLLPGRIYDINAYSLGAAVLECGGKPMRLGVVPDDFEILQKTLKQALSSADIVVTSGGVSVGPKDIMPKVLASLGTPGIILSGIAIKPGKPTTMGLIGEKPVFLLPGHPTSALMVFHLIARPVIQLMAGRKETIDPTVKAIASTRMFSAKGRKTFVMVTLKQDKSGKVLAIPVSTGDSGAITTLTKADGFVTIPQNVQFVDFNQEITVHLFQQKLWS